MKKKLPNIYKGIVKNTNQNQKQSLVSSSLQEKKEEINKEQRTNLNGKSVNRQIKDVFSSPNFVYKANVSIKLTDGTIQEKTIIGRTNNSLITIDDELIDVSKISQIDFLD